jgi:excisionase family DNA binding protein
MTPESLPPRFVGIKQAARDLGISRAGLYRLLDAGDIESVHIGRRRLVVVASLDALEAELRAAA